MSQEQRNVILVEDDLTVLHSLRLQMREILPAHYHIETANDGDEALEVLSEIIADGGMVPIIVTDHQMPRMTGSEFLIKTRQLVPKCRNIMLTGEAGLTDITKLINEQALFRYLSKPWIQTDLEMTVLSALESFNQEYKLEKLNYELAETNANLENIVNERTRELLLKTRELNQGLEYAKLMQENLLPKKKDFESFFSRVDVVYEPYTIVSGDFYSFFQQSENNALVIVGDATGHGLAGAFLSSICLGIINDIVRKGGLLDSMEILTEILTRFRSLSSFATESMKRMVSVELTVVYIDKSLGKVSYASNGKQLILAKSGVRLMPKEKQFRCCLGNEDSAQELKHRGRQGTANLADVDTLVLFTDGISDQFTQSTFKKLGRKGLVSALPDITSFGATDWFRQIKGNQPAIDDATLLFLRT